MTGFAICACVCLVLGMLAAFGLAFYIGGLFGYFLANRERRQEELQLRVKQLEEKSSSNSY